MPDDTAALPRGDLVVVQPGQGASYWQPVPANGHIEVLLSPETVRMEHKFGLGTQTVAPRCYVRKHLHDKHEEVLLVLSGTGEAELDTGTHPMAPGTAIFIGRNRIHLFRNTGAQDLTVMWLILPNGLEDFFAAIGRKRVAGEPAPEPFARPADVQEIERRTVFGALPASS
jgi:quercetin dioxygenase-like cupin family protein